MRPALAALCLVAACSAVVPDTAARLAATDPLTADPAGLAVALALPEGMAPGPDPAMLRLTLVADGMREDLALPLAPVAAPDLKGAEGAVLALALTAEGVDRMKALQRRAQGAAHGSLALGLGIPGCRVGAGPAAGATGAAWLRLAAGEPFRPLIRPARLDALLGPGALAGLRPCPGTVLARR